MSNENEFFTHHVATMTVHTQNLQECLLFVNSIRNTQQNLILSVLLQNFDFLATNMNKICFVNCNCFRLKN